MLRNFQCWNAETTLVLAVYEVSTRICTWSGDRCAQKIFASKTLMCAYIFWTEAEVYFVVGRTRQAWLSRMPVASPFRKPACTVSNWSLISRNSAHILPNLIPSPREDRPSLHSVKIWSSMRAFYAYNPMVVGRNLKQGALCCEKTGWRSTCGAKTVFYETERQFCVVEHSRVEHKKTKTF